MLPTTRVSETGVIYYTTHDQQLCGDIAEEVSIGVDIVTPCSGTNASGTTKSVVNPKRLSSWLDDEWYKIGVNIAWGAYRIKEPTSANGSNLTDKKIALLEAIAVVGNIDQFARIYREINLNDRTENDIVCIVQLALNIGAPSLAKEACERGLTRFPNNKELSEMYSIFAPPQVTVSQRQPLPGIRLNTEWLTAHGDEYRGKWVALRAGTLVAAADSVNDLLKITGDVRGKDIFITPIH